MAKINAEKEKEVKDYDSMLVTGGTGFLGLHTCRHFESKGLDVVADDIKNFEEGDDVEAEYVECDVRNKEKLREVMESHDVVVHSAMALPNEPPKKIKEVGIEGTRNVLEIANEQDVERVVFISSTATYGTHDKHPITEETELDGVGPYGDAKIEAEKVCREFRDEHDMTVPILRPKTFIGPYRLGVFQILFDWVEDGASIPMVGDGNNLYQLMHVQDLVDAVEMMITLPPERVNTEFNVGADDYGTMREDFGALIDYADTGKNIRGTPAPLTVWSLRILRKVGLSPLYPWVYETAHEDSYVSVEKLKDIGWEPEYSNKDALIDTYKWYKQEYIKGDRNLGTGDDHRVAWDQGALKLVKQIFKLI
jgi:nucleoside-diphosphate-sugar epimerase